MSIWRHLLVDGEYAERSRILSGLQLECIASRPTGASHSIYEELWHITKWQSIVLSGDADRRAAWVPGARYPEATAPANQAEFDELVSEFLRGLATAERLTRIDENLQSEIAGGQAFRDELACLAVHNAYHLAKIVALRQQLGCWDPPQ